MYVRCLIVGKHKAAAMGLFFVVCFLLPFCTLQHKEVTGKDGSYSSSRQYMVALFRGQQLVCGGTLINKNWVLTATQCFPDKNTQVIIGAKSRMMKGKERRIATITKIFSYPGFNEKTFENDILVMQIESKPRINTSSKPVPLPKTPEDIKPGSRCTVPGWGTLHSKKGFKTLHEDNVTIIDRKICNDKHHYNSHFVTGNMVCAGDNKAGRNKCWGDAGGPLICNAEQRGVISFVKTCGDSRYPGLYTLLTKKYLSWIQAVIANGTNSH